jgi:hypothetical protein
LLLAQYGNEAELTVKYNSVALVVKVPSWEERKPKTMGEEEEKKEDREEQMVDVNDEEEIGPSTTTDSFMP